MSFDFDAVIGPGGGLAAAILSDTEDDVVAASSSPRVAAWRLWARGEALRRDDAYRRARPWLVRAGNVAASADRGGGELWRAEHATSLGHVELVLGEPGAAVAWSEAALRGWEQVQALLSGDPAMAVEPLVLQVTDMWEALAALGEAGRAAASPAALMLGWTKRYVERRHDCVFRLLTALAEAHDPGRASEVADQHIAWMQPRITPDGQHPWLYDLRMKLGDVHSATGDHRQAAREYDRAAALFGDADRHDHDGLERAAYARFNAANELARAGERADAERRYRSVRTTFQELEDNDAVLRVDHALLSERRNTGESAGLLAELRELIERYKALLAESRPDDPLTPVRRENMAQAQRLLLSTMARAGDEEGGAKSVLGTLDALREARAGAPGYDREEWRTFVPGVMEVVTRRAARLSDTCILVVEGGVGNVVFVAVGKPAGASQLTTVVEEAGVGLFAAAEALIQSARDTSDALIAESLPLRSGASERMRGLASAVWREIPPSIADLVRRCSTLVFTPDIRTGLDELPLELVHTGDGWLGLDHRIVRAPSPSHVADILAPNAVPPAPDASAYVLRAEDPAELGQLLNADQDAARAARAMGLLGLTARLAKAPAVDDALAELEAGHRVVHYVGHGVAGDLGEALFLRGDERIDTRALGGLAPHRAPFVFLSCCLAGRARYLQGGDEAGFGVALLERGSPGVIAATYAVPDRACSDIAVAFYRECASHPVGEALRRARVALHASRLHPVAWSAFTLQGDPNWWLAATPAPSPSSRDVGIDAGAHVGRFALSRSDDDRRAALAALRADVGSQDGASDLMDWIATAFTSDVPADAERDRMCREIAARDRYTAATFRALLGLERLEAEPRRPQGDELSLGVTLALRLHDDFLLSGFAGALATRGIGDLSLRQTVALLDAGSTRGSGLAAWHERFAPALDRIEKARTLLGSMKLIDAGDAFDTGLILERERIAADAASSSPPRPWTDWLLRMMGTSGVQPGWDLRAWIRAERDRGAGTELLDALEHLLGEFHGPGEVPDETYDAVLEHIDDERERLVVEVFRRFDLVVSHAHDFSDQTAEEGLTLANVLGDPCARSFFLNVRAERSYRQGDAEAADAEGSEGAEILRQLAASDPVFEEQAAKATRNATTFAMACGDFAKARRLAGTLRNTRYAPVGDDPLAFLLEAR
jgi:tetratricopeptide (TPR) repeat protein